MVAKPLCPLYKNIIKHLDRARYPELRYQFVLAVKKYKVQCATNSVSEEKYNVGVQSIVKAYQKKAKEEQLNIDFASLLA